MQLEYMGLLQMGSLHWQSDSKGLQVLALTTGVQLWPTQSANADPLKASMRHPLAIKNKVFIPCSPCVFFLLYLKGANI